MHPLLFQIPLGESTLVLFGNVLWLGPLDVPAFGALLALGLGLGALATLRLAERAGLGHDAVVAALVAALLAGVVGSRLGFVALHPGLLESWGAAFSLRSGGLSSSLGVVAGAGVAWASARRNGSSSATLFDAAAPGFGLAIALGRLGCYLEGCDFGRDLSTAAPRWLARLGTFPMRSHAWAAQVSAGALAPDAPVSLPVHPSQLYECIAGLVLAGLALRLRERARAPGTTALVVIALYFWLRVLVDLSRPPSADAWLARGLALAAGLATVRWLLPRGRARHP